MGLQKSSAADKGVYVLWLYLPHPSRITVGRLGTFLFERGVYAYCGSAQRNLAARLARHRGIEKNLHWHIDYLRAHARYLGEVAHLGRPKEAECQLAAGLLQLPASYFPVPGFGASDCSCVSHLVKVPLAAPFNCIFWRRG